MPHEYDWLPEAAAFGVLDEAPVAALGVELDAPYVRVVETGAEHEEKDCIQLVYRQ